MDVRVDAAVVRAFDGLIGFPNMLAFFLLQPASNPIETDLLGPLQLFE